MRTRKMIWTMGMALCIIVSSGLRGSTFREGKGIFPVIPTEEYIDSLYQSIKTTENKPSLELFSNGLLGYHKLLEEGRLENSRFLTLIDFSISSKNRRLWVIDLEDMSIRHHSFVAHGKNTGDEYALRFSNIPNSNMSSLGF